MSDLFHLLYRTELPRTKYFGKCKEEESAWRRFLLTLNSNKYKCETERNECPNFDVPININFRCNDKIYFHLFSNDWTRIISSWFAARQQVNPEAFHADKQFEIFITDNEWAMVHYYCVSFFQMNFSIRQSQTSFKNYFYWTSYLHLFSLTKPIEKIVLHRTFVVRSGDDNFQTCTLARLSLNVAERAKNRRKSAHKHILSWATIHLLRYTWKNTKEQLFKAVLENFTSKSPALKVKWKHYWKICPSFLGTRN